MVVTHAFKFHRNAYCLYLSKNPEAMVHLNNSAMLDTSYVILLVFSLIQSARNYGMVYKPIKYTINLTATMSK